MIVIVILTGQLIAIALGQVVVIAIVIVTREWVPDAGDTRVEVLGDGLVGAPRIKVVPNLEPPAPRLLLTCYYDYYHFTINDYYFYYYYHFTNYDYHWSILGDGLVGAPRIKVHTYDHHQYDQGLLL